MLARLRIPLAAILLLCPSVAQATWSVIAVDRATGRLVVSSATCVPQAGFARFPAKGLMDVQAIIAPGFGVAAAQAGVDRTRANQSLIFAELAKGTHPSAIVSMLMADTLIQTRQFGIVDLQGRFAGFSGAKNGVASNSVQGQVAGTEIYYSIQGNILASYAVVQNAVQALERTNGSLEDRVMAAMEAADAAGGRAMVVARQAARSRRATPWRRTGFIGWGRVEPQSRRAGGGAPSPVLQRCCRWWVSPARGAAVG